MMKMMIATIAATAMMTPIAMPACAPGASPEDDAAAAWLSSAVDGDALAEATTPGEGDEVAE